MRLRLFHLVLMSAWELDAARSDAYLEALGDAKKPSYWDGYADALEDVAGGTRAARMSAGMSSTVTALADATGVLSPDSHPAPRTVPIQRGHLRLVQP